MEQLRRGPGLNPTGGDKIPGNTAPNIWLELPPPTMGPLNRSLIHSFVCPATVHINHVPRIVSGGGDAEMNKAPSAPGGTKLNKAKKEVTFTYNTMC